MEALEPVDEERDYSARNVSVQTGYRAEFGRSGPQGLCGKILESYPTRQHFSTLKIWSSKSSGMR